MKAFPMAHPSVECRFIDSGMDLRDYFAGQVLQGILALGDLGNSNEIPFECYRLADKMMEVRNG